MDAAKVLDELIDQLDEAINEWRARHEGADAIDAILASPGRSSTVRSLRDDAVMAKFRQELSDGFARVDTVGKVLDLLGVVVGALLAGRL